MLPGRPSGRTASAAIMSSRRSARSVRSSWFSGWSLQMGMNEPDAAKASATETVFRKIGYEYVAVRDRPARP